jgi:hypothetical protein
VVGRRWLAIGLQPYKKYANGTSKGLLLPVSIDWTLPMKEGGIVATKIAKGGMPKSNPTFA